MSVFAKLAAVRKAQAEVVLARGAVAVPASSLVARGYENPLTVVSVASGAGFVLGLLNVHPLRVPGLVSLVTGGAAELAGKAAMMAAGNFMGGGDTPDP
jgi:hypothetical protein